MLKQLLLIIAFGVVVGCGAPTERLDESLESALDASPESALGATTGADANGDAVPGGGFKKLKSGEFEDRVHKTNGSAAIFEKGGELILRLENFDVDNGPDLFIYLTKSADGTFSDEDSFLNVDKLKSTRGNFNYKLPPGFDASQYNAAVVYCKFFQVLWGVAELKSSS